VVPFPKEKAELRSLGENLNIDCVFWGKGGRGGSWGGERENDIEEGSFS